MVTRDTIGPGEADDGDERKKTSWAEQVGDWGDRWGAGEGVYVPPMRPIVWRREDSGFAAVCADLDRDADHQIEQIIRHRALAGDIHALGLGFRSIRGMARPVDTTPPERLMDQLDPEVAGAMLEAGLRAMGEELPDIPDTPVRPLNAVAPDGRKVFGPPYPPGTRWFPPGCGP